MQSNNAGARKIICTVAGLVMLLFIGAAAITTCSGQKVFAAPQAHSRLNYVYEDGKLSIVQDDYTGVQYLIVIADGGGVAITPLIARSGVGTSLYYKGE